MTTEQVRALAKQMLSARRFHHVENMAKQAVQLAEKYGVDPEKAEMAAWLHDIVKEQSDEELLQLLRQDAIIAKSTQQRPRPIWHGPAAAVYAKHELGITDEEILSAVASHTTGNTDMSQLDKVIFLADAISEERDYPGVDSIRQLAQQSLNKAVIATLEQSIQFVQAKGKPLDKETVQALQALRRVETPQ